MQRELHYTKVMLARMEHQVASYLCGVMFQGDWLMHT
jgi:hypothetical protein